MPDDLPTHVTKRYAVFLSPGTFFDEETAREIPDLPLPQSVELAVAMAKDVTERHGAKPYGFVFHVKEWDEFTQNGQAFKTDVRVTQRPGIFFLGGTVKTLDDIPDTPENHILRSNMRNNGYQKVIENNNSWRVTKPFGDDDVLLETPRGADADADADADDDDDDACCAGDGAL